MARADPPLYRGAPTAAFDAVRLGLPLRPTSWSAWDALWAYLLSTLLSVGAAAAVALTGAELYGPAFLLLVLAPWVGLIGWPLWVTRRRGNGAVVDLGLALGQRDAGRGVVGGIASFVLGMVAGVVTIYLFGDFSAAAVDEAQRVADASGAVVLLAFAVLVVVGAPIAEELTFRGLLWSGLAKRGVPPWACIAVTAVAFAAVHFEPRRLLVLVTIGAVLGAVRWWTGSLGACMVAHGVNNLPAALGLLALLGE